MADINAALQRDPDNYEALNTRAMVYAAVKDARALPDMAAMIRLRPGDGDPLVERGNFYFGQQDFDHAIADYAAAVKIQPDNDMYGYNLALAYDAKGDSARALEIYNQVLRRTPDFADALAGRGMLYAKQAKYELALADFNAVLKLRPNAAAINDIAKVYLSQKDFDRALALLDQAIAAEPDNMELYLNRAYGRSQKGDTGGAIADYTRLLQLDPGNPAVLGERGRAYAAKGDYASAIADYDQVMKIQPSAAAELGRAGAYFAAADYDHAIADYSDVIQREPGNFYAFNGRGAAYLYKKDYARALPDFDKAIAIDPKQVDAWLYRGQAYAEKADLDRAIADANQALKLVPGDARALALRGSAHANKEELDDALADFNEVIRQNPGEGAIYLIRAAVYAGRKDYPRALADNDKAVDLMPDNAVAYARRCWNRAAANQDLEKALADCDKAIALNPRDADNFDDRGMVYFRMGKFGLAKTDYDAAIAITPLGQTLYMRGVTKNRLGDATGGKADIAAGLAIDPEAGDFATRAGITP